MATDQLPIYDIARAVGVHPNTVAARVRRMVAARFFLPTTAFLDSNRLGFVGGRFFVPLPLQNRPRDRLPRVFRVGGVFGCYDSVEGWDFIVFAETDKLLESRAVKICRILGHPDYAWETRFSEDWPMGAGRVHLGAVDVRILRSFLREPSQPAKGLLPTGGLTKRTIQLHLKRMRSEGILRMYMAGGVAPAHMTLAYLCAILAPTPDGASTLENLKRMMPNSFMRFIVPTKPRFMLWAPSLRTLTSLAEQVARMPGVIETRFRLIQSFEWNPAYPAWVCDLLERRLEGTKRPQKPAGAS